MEVHMEPASQWHQNQQKLRKDQLKQVRKEERTSSIDRKKSKPKLQDMEIPDIRELVPLKYREIKDMTSISYLLMDYIGLMSSFFTFPIFNYFSIFGLIVYWVLYGFGMWCVFVVGHDCVHHTFGTSGRLNRIFGRICLTPLLTPYTAFRVDHLEHHLHVGHYRKGNQGHQYFSTRQLESLSPPMKIFWKYLSPLFGYGAYVLGLFQFEPIRNPNEMLTDTQIDNYSILLFLMCYYNFAANNNPITFFKMYGGCWLMFSLWVFAVSYMQRFRTRIDIDDSKSVASDSTVMVPRADARRYKPPQLYDDSTWAKEAGALSIGNHELGFGLDVLQHHSTNYATIHYLFYDDIPHYNLKATHEVLKQKIALFNSKKRARIKHDGLFLVNFWHFFSKFGLTRFLVITTDTKALREGRSAKLPFKLKKSAMTPYELKYGLKSVLVRRKVHVHTSKEIKELMKQESLIWERHILEESEVETFHDHTPRDSLHSSMFDKKLLDELRALDESARESEIAADEIQKKNSKVKKTFKRASDKQVAPPPIRRTRTQVLQNRRAQLDAERRRKQLHTTKFTTVTRNTFYRPYKLYTSSNPWEVRSPNVPRKKAKSLNVQNDSVLAAMRALNPRGSLHQMQRDRELEEKRKKDEEEDMKLYLKPVKRLRPFPV